MLKNTSCKAILAALGLAMLICGCASDNTFSLGAVTVGMLFDDIEERATSLVESTENSANNVVNNAAYNAINTIRQLREEYKILLDLAFSELTTQQRMAFEGIEYQLDLLFSHIDDEHDRIDDTLDNLAIYLSDSIFVSDVPRITRFLTGTSVYTPVNTNPLTIRFRGKNLNHDKNNLIVTLSESIELKPVEMSDNHLSFLIDPDRIEGFASLDKMTLIPIEVSLFENVFLFVVNERKYKYRVRVLPNHLASVVIHYKELVPEVVERKKKEVGGPTGSFESGRTSRNSRNVSMTAYPDEGYRIDPNKVSIDSGISNRCSSAETRCSSTGNEDVGSGSCAIVSERGHAYRRVTCSYRLTMGFIQYKEVERVIAHQTDPMPLTYDKPLAWDIPEGKTFSRIEAQLFDGRTVMYEQGTKGPILKFSLDAASRTIMISHNLDLDELN